MKPDWVERIGGRSLEVAHFHIITDDPIARQQGRRLVADARLMLGQADAMRAPGVKLNGLKRHYADGSRVEVVYNEGGPLVAKLFPAPIPVTQPQERDWEEPKLEATHKFLWVGMVVTDRPGDGVISPVMIAWEPGAPTRSHPDDGSQRDVLGVGMWTNGDGEYGVFYYDTWTPNYLMDRAWTTRGAYLEQTSYHWHILDPGWADLWTSYPNRATDTIDSVEYWQVSSGTFGTLRCGPIEDPSDPSSRPWNSVFVADPHEGHGRPRHANRYSRRNPKEYTLLEGDLAGNEFFSKPWRPSRPYSGNYKFKAAGYLGLGTLYAGLEPDMAVEMRVVSGTGSHQTIADFDMSVTTAWENDGNIEFESPFSLRTIVATARGSVRLDHDHDEQWPSKEYS